MSCFNVFFVPPTSLETKQITDYVAKDIDLVDFGCKEFDIAETEMPGFIALRSEYRESKPPESARIVGSLLMTIQTAV